ncbi:MAG TPA: FtsX-like permease family protein, partial [Spirochaetia bacterium]|nr:FtsX-like permease family protein [Spirochaetia bacterium]
LRAIPQVRDVVPGLSFTAVASAGGKTTTVLVTALPVARTLGNLSSRGIFQGKDLVPGRSGQILVGRGVARKLSLAPGASVSLFALTSDGGVNTQSYAVSGTTQTIISAVDNVSVFMDLGDAQSLVSSQAVPQLIVFLKKTADTDRVASLLRNAPAGSALSGLTIRTWEQLSPYYRQANGAYQLVLGVARLIVLIVALFSIAGTLSLAVMERLREIGTLRAFGSQRRRVLLMFLFEGLVLGIAGAVIGCLAGGGLSWLIGALGGITMPAQPGTSSGFKVLFTPQTSRFVANGLCVLVVSVVAAVFPGMLASRRRIADLLRAR